MHSAHDLLTRWPALDVAAKRARLQNTFQLSAGPLVDALHTRAGVAERATAGLWRRDPSVWSDVPAVQKIIADRLGWLNSPVLMAESIERLQSFATSIRESGFTDVVLLGMGGSSLAPEVLRAILGAAPGWPRLQVLDSTDPAAIRAAQTAPQRTLYLLASKSGKTIEPNVLAAHFQRTLVDAGVSRWADHFVAITDEGTPLSDRARAEGFRELFINPFDIGGRYSALSFFGLVPAALMGHDLASLLGWGIAMLAACQTEAGAVTTNPAAALGLAMGGAARAGRDKLTLLLPDALEPFGLWVEQLVAESTGKEQLVAESTDKKVTGIIPITSEPLTEPSAYGADRMFVRVRLHGSYAEEMRDGRVRDLKAANAPVAEIDLAEPAALGAEFVRWEIATAIAGALLHINPFDEPNVKQAKDATGDLLASYKIKGHLPVPSPDRALDGEIALTASVAARGSLDGKGPEALLTLIHPGDYFALLAYLGPDKAIFEALRAFRLAVHARTHAATMVAYGPRYLHSTGQLHKGGPNSGVFVLVSATPLDDLPIPDEPYSFGTLELAQGLGDFMSLDSAGRRALHVHLSKPDPELIHRVAEAMLARLPRPG